jgi:raffinose/stachyose/melibiose transport system permease protein
MNRYTFRTFVLEVGMVLTAVVFFVPLYVLVNLSLKAPNDPTGPLQLPANPTFTNFSDAWVQGNLGNAIVNSTAVTVSSVALIIAVSATAAYPLARVTSRFSRVLFFFFMVGLLLPFQLALIPLYVTMRDLGLVGSVGGLTLYYLGLQTPFSIFLYTSFIRGIPVEYEEAARIDGCGPFATFWRVLFPLLRPVTGTVIILNVIAVWNDLLTPLLYLSGSGQQTIPVALVGFAGQYVTQWNLIFAGLIISIAPILLVYFLMQRTIIKGFASGLKG